MSRFHSIRWTLTSAFLLVVLATIGLLGLYLSEWTDRYYVSALRSSLDRESRLVGGLSAPLVSSGARSVDPLAMNAGRDLGRRVTIIRRDGVVLGDSQHDITSMDLHLNRPEVRGALTSGSGWSIRYSKTLRTRMLYVATRITSGGQPVGVARVSESLAEVDQARRRIHQAFFAAGLIAFILAGIAGAQIAGRIAGPIQDIGAVAGRLAKGQLEQRVQVRPGGRDEIDQLGATLNTMAEELRRTIDELAAEKSKFQAILERTDDGLMVVDGQARVQMTNPAAAGLLATQARQIQGKTVIESTLSHDLAEMVDRVLRTQIPAALEIQLAGAEQPYVKAYVAPLDAPRGGAVVVLHDLTAAKRMDSVRRDFVANVSHELRTPLASIKAMAETILLRAQEDPGVAAEFAKKVVEEAERLTALSDDLLDLARIEAGRRPIRSERFALAEVGERVASEFGPKAQDKRIELRMEMPGDLEIDADRDAVYQIFANLVDNAVKYTPAGGQVTVSASEENGQVAVQVADTGVGIPKSDLPRIFERFYRADKARSRQSGGTGLGLSIVKHLVEAHGGTVSVESAPNRGSTFTFTLPRA